jgi:hypothetical protein
VERKAIRCECEPLEGIGGSLYAIDPPLALDNGVQAYFVVTSFGGFPLDEWESFNVFPADAQGRVLDWAGLVDVHPQWCSALLAME